jgi:hypothetical protein
LLGHATLAVVAVAVVACTSANPPTPAPTAASPTPPTIPGRALRACLDDAAFLQHLAGKVNVATVALYQDVPHREDYQAFVTVARSVRDALDKALIDKPLASFKRKMLRGLGQVIEGGQRAIQSAQGSSEHDAAHDEFDLGLQVFDDAQVGLTDADTRCTEAFGGGIVLPTVLP